RGDEHDARSGSPPPVAEPDPRDEHGGDGGEQDDGHVLHPADRLGCAGAHRSSCLPLLPCRMYRARNVIAVRATTPTVAARFQVSRATMSRHSGWTPSFAPWIFSTPG